MKTLDLDLQDAIERAMAFHSGHTRKSPRPGGPEVPYIVHPMEVMYTIAKFGMHDMDVLKAALLHDTIEDTNATYEGILYWFNEKIAKIVKEMTFEWFGDPDDPAKKIAKAAYLESFHRASLPAILIKVVDRCCNVTDYCYKDPVYARKYFDMADDVFAAWNDQQHAMAGSYGDFFVTYMNDLIKRTKELVNRFDPVTFERVSRKRQKL